MIVHKVLYIDILYHYMTYHVYLYLNISIDIYKYVYTANIHFEFPVLFQGFSAKFSNNIIPTKASCLCPLPSLQVGTAGNATSESLCWVAGLQGLRMGMLEEAMGVWMDL